MASRDPAFQWETEVLRSSPRRARGSRGGNRETVDRGDWLTIKEASEATGVPASTIRKWARHDNIPSFLEKRAEGDLRVVSMGGIARWTEEIGRNIEVEETPPQTDMVALAPVESAEDRSRHAAVPEGSMLVPLDAWNRMLNQLGNLHEAGQQLADARERAAKAETEARFLKERLAELREQLAEAKTEHRTSGAEETSPTRDLPSPASLVKQAYDGWRARRRRV